MQITFKKPVIWSPTMLEEARQWWSTNGGHFNDELYQKIKQIKLPKKAKIA